MANSGYNWQLTQIGKAIERIADALEKITAPKSKEQKKMRKIENITDWTKFIGDARCYARNRGFEPDIYFAVSKDGTNWDGQATINYRLIPSYVDEFYTCLSWQDVTNAKKDMSPRDFYADIIELLGGESFYICDTGANYNWL